MEVFKTETKIGLNKDKRTLSRKVFEYLYNDILFLKLKPGQLIKEKEISTKLDVSRTPIREALLKLEDEGLVEIYPQRGTYISKISIESVYESHFIRESIEIATVKNAIEYGSVDFFKELNDINNKYKNKLTDNNINMLYKIKEKNINNLYRVDEEFHKKISTFSFDKKIWNLLNTIKTDMNRVRLLGLNDPGRPFLVHKEHQIILDSIIKKDNHEAEIAVKKHLKYIFKEIKSAKNKYEMFFSK